MLCERCTALCCRYFALPIDTPRTPADYDDIRWYLAHESVHIFIEDGDWFLAIQTRCQYLGDDNRCGVYEDRPRICREYTTDNCDYHIGQYEFEQYFSSPEQLELYAQQKLGKKYVRYVLKQRRKNLDLSKDDLKHDERHHHRMVLAARARPHVRGHPGRHRDMQGRRQSHPGAPVTLTVSVRR
jgi:Fe-S-cluster containining protein